MPATSYNFWVTMLCRKSDFMLIFVFFYKKIPNNSINNIYGFFLYWTINVIKQTKRKTERIYSAKKFYLRYRHTITHPVLILYTYWNFRLLLSIIYISVELFKFVHFISRQVVEKQDLCGNEWGGGRSLDTLRFVCNLKMFNKHFLYRFLFYCKIYM